ncbi:GNAT family N-acetyltransferase [Herbiconiux sp. SYSU D00978]|uniref:GNAT family N-acetyltransferase n=1 Tax=Herbiconiux sp. SYSU D00978 TaxID=2812562 RepID=UPI001A971C71|nr:GNAT family N-acetyltransferase [Herbiconiux sp. SYSU D00978]
MTTEVRNESGNSRYELHKDGELAGFAEYVIRDGEIIFTHTEIDPEKRESGMGSQLVQSALDDVRANTDYRVRPACPFVAAFIDEHPEYSELTER